MNKEGYAVICPDCCGPKDTPLTHTFCTRCEMKREHVARFGCNWHGWHLSSSCAECNSIIQEGNP